MMKKLLFSKLWLAAFAGAVCFHFSAFIRPGEEAVRLKNLKAFLNASSATERGGLMSEQYRFFFEEKKGEGKTKSASLQSFEKWDGPLHPDIEIKEHKTAGDVWTIKIREQNDFSKLIGFPGWTATEQITFDEQDKIKEVIYIPDAGQPEYRDYLKPALDWLKEHEPSGLAEVYDLEKKRLIQTEVSAKKWVELLRLWRERTQQK